MFDLNEENYNKKVAEGGIVLVDCWASWCEACKTFAPVYERVAASFPKHAFAKLDSQTEQNLIEMLTVETIPSLLLYRDGLLLFKQPGYFDEEQLRDIVRQAETLDMELVRADIADEEQRRENELH